MNNQLNQGLPAGNTRAQAEKRLENIQDNAARDKIFRILKGLLDLPKVSLEKIDELRIFEIHHPQQFVPDFRFEWCEGKKHYRVYIKVASTEHDKENAGYTICTIGSQFAAMGFGAVYGFLHKHRANNRETA